MRDEELRELQVARLVPIAAGQRRHRRTEVGASSVVAAVETPREERVVAGAEPTGLGRSDVDAGAAVVLEGEDLLPAIDAGHQRPDPGWLHESSPVRPHFDPPALSRHPVPWL